MFTYYRQDNRGKKFCDRTKYISKEKVGCGFFEWVSGDERSKMMEMGDNFSKKMAKLENSIDDVLMKLYQVQSSIEDVM